MPQEMMAYSRSATALVRTLVIDHMRNMASLSIGRELETSASPNDFE